MNDSIAHSIQGAIYEFKRWQLWFPAFIVIIAAVSLYDTYLIIRFEDSIGTSESNPVGIWLLKIADGEIGVFVRVKLAGTIVVLSALITMWKWRVRMLFSVTSSLASFQAGLLFYLTAA